MSRVKLRRADRRNSSQRRRDCASAWGATGAPGARAAVLARTVRSRQRSRSVEADQHVPAALQQAEVDAAACRPAEPRREDAEELPREDAEELRRDDAAEGDSAASVEDAYDTFFAWASINGAKAPLSTRSGVPCCRECCMERAALPPRPFPPAPTAPCMGAGVTGIGDEASAACLHFGVRGERGIAAQQALAAEQLVLEVRACPVAVVRAIYGSGVVRP